MDFGGVKEGLVLTAGVCAVISLGAYSVVRQLLRQARTEQLVAYLWFWLFTGILWGLFSLRYAFLAFGERTVLTFTLYLASQTVILFTGPVLFYYLGLRVTAHHWLARVLAVQCLAAAVVAAWFLYQPDGVSMLPEDWLSAEVRLNRISRNLFLAEVGGILAFLAVDVRRRWVAFRDNPISRYELLYSVALAAYLTLAVLDQGTRLTGLPLFGLRLLYPAVFSVVHRALRLQRAVFASVRII